MLLSPVVQPATCATEGWTEHAYHHRAHCPLAQECARHTGPRCAGRTMTHVTNTTLAASDSWCGPVSASDWSHWPSSCALETTQAVLHAVFVLSVFQYVLTLLAQDDTPVSPGSLRRTALNSPTPSERGGSRPSEATFRTADALRLGLSAAAVTNWLVALLVRGIASMSMFLPYHTILMCSAAVSWICYLALAIELDQIHPTAEPSSAYTFTKRCWLGGQLLLELALLPSLMGSENVVVPINMSLSHQLRQFSTVVQLAINAAACTLELYSRYTQIYHTGPGGTPGLSPSQAVSLPPVLSLAEDGVASPSPSPSLQQKQLETPPLTQRLDLSLEATALASSALSGARGGEVGGGDLKESLLSREHRQTAAAMSDFHRARAQAYASLPGEIRHKASGPKKLAIRLYFVCAGFGTRMVWYSFNVALPYFTFHYGPQQYAKMLLGYNIGALLALTTQVLLDAQFDEKWGVLRTYPVRINVGLSVLFVSLVRCVRI